MFPPARSVALGAAALTLALAAATPAAQAATKRMVTYDSASPDAKRLTGAGLTFVFTKSMMRTRILAVRATAVPVGVIPRPLNDGGTVRKLDVLMGEDRGSGTLYEIDPAAAEGKVMIQAFCPGAKSGWLAVGPFAHGRDLRVHAFGAEPGGEPRLCATMDFAWHGEWRMPNTNSSDITARVNRPDYIKTLGN
ncbi:MAG: hypothetical protein V4466_04520 [Pseudomonadota bacterium]